MNKRKFLSDILAAGVACAFLPGAGRVWTKLSSGLVVPDAESTISFIASDGRVLYRRTLEPFEQSTLLSLMTEPLGPVARLLDVQCLDANNFTLRQSLNAVGLMPNGLALHAVPRV